MLVVVLSIDVIVVVEPSELSAGVVRRVDVDEVDRLSMRVGQHLEGVEVLGVDHRMERLALSVLDTISLAEAGIDAGAELGHGDGDLAPHALSPGLVAADLTRMGQANSVCLLDSADAPEAVITRPRRSTGWKHSYLVAATHRLAGQLDSLGLMLLEDETERATFGERGDLGFQISTELRIGLACLPQQLRQSRQWCALLARTDAT